MICSYACSGDFLNSVVLQACIGHVSKDVQFIWSIGSILAIFHLKFYISFSADYKLHIQKQTFCTWPWANLFIDRILLFDVHDIIYLAMTARGAW